MKQSITAFAWIAVLLLCAPALMADEGDDQDITLELYRMDEGVSWSRHDERCVETNYTYCKHADGGKGFPCMNGDTIHIDFKGCADDETSHIKFAFTDKATGADVCTVEISCKGFDGCQLSVTAGPAPGYECGAGDEGGIPTIRIANKSED